MALAPDSDDASIDALAPILRQALDGSAEAIAVYTAEDWVIASTIVYANRALCELSGYAEQHFIGHSALLLAGAKPDTSSLDSILPPAGVRELVTRTRKQRPDGSAYRVEVRVTPLRAEDGTVTHYLARQQKLETVRAAPDGALERVRDASFSQLAAGVAYELDGLISKCLFGLGSAIAAGAGRGYTDPALVAAREAATAMASTVRGLQSFTREGDQATAPVDVHDALDLALRLSGPVLRDRAVIDRRYSPVAPVTASLPRLARIFSHVLRNAGESIPPSMPHANHVTVETREDADGRVAVIVTDTGVGIEREDLSFVCDPFFTTKPDAATHGLGLTAARADLTELGGDLRIESIVGRGTRVRITLPAADNAACDIARPFVDGPVQLTASTWHEGLERLALGERFDLVVCDTRSPLIDEFRARLRDAAPESMPRVFDVSVATREQSGMYPRVNADEPGIAAAE